MVLFYPLIIYFIRYIILLFWVYFHGVCCNIFVFVEILCVIWAVDLVHTDSCRCRSALRCCCVFVSCFNRWEPLHRFYLTSVLCIVSDGFHTQDIRPHFASFKKAARCSALKTTWVKLCSSGNTRTRPVAQRWNNRHISWWAYEHTTRFTSHIKPFMVKYIVWQFSQNYSF